MDSADFFLPVFEYNLSDFNGCLLLHVFSTQIHYDFSTQWHTDPAPAPPSLFTLFFHSSAHTGFGFHTSIFFCIAVVAGPSSSSVPDGISDDVTLLSDCSAEPRGKAPVQGKDDHIGQVV